MTQRSLRRRSRRWGRCRRQAGRVDPARHPRFPLRYIARAYVNLYLSLMRRKNQAFVARLADAAVPMRSQMFRVPAGQSEWGAPGPAGPGVATSGSPSSGRCGGGASIGSCSSSGFAGGAGSASSVMHPRARPDRFPKRGLRSQLLDVLGGTQGLAVPNHGQ